MRNAAACESGSGLCSAPHSSAARGHTGAGQRTLVISCLQQERETVTRYADVMGQPPGHQPSHQPSPAQPSPSQHTCPFFKQVLAGAQCSVEPRPPAPGRARWAVRAVWRAPLSPALTASPHTLTPRLSSPQCDHLTSPVTM